MQHPTARPSAFFRTHLTYSRVASVFRFYRLRHASARCPCQQTLLSLTPSILFVTNQTLTRMISAAFPLLLTSTSKTTIFPRKGTTCPPRPTKCQRISRLRIIPMTLTTAMTARAQNSEQIGHRFHLLPRINCLCLSAHAHLSAPYSRHYTGNNDNSQDSQEQKLRPKQNSVSDQISFEYSTVKTHDSLSAKTKDSLTLKDR